MRRTPVGVSRGANPATGWPVRPCARTPASDARAGHRVQPAALEKHATLLCRQMWLHAGCSGYERPIRHVPGSPGRRGLFPSQLRCVPARPVREVGPSGPCRYRRGARSVHDSALSQNLPARVAPPVPVGRGCGSAAIACVPPGPGGQRILAPATRRTRRQVVQAAMRPGLGEEAPANTGWRGRCMRALPHRWGAVLVPVAGRGSDANPEAARRMPWIGTVVTRPPPAMALPGPASRSSAHRAAGWLCAAMTRPTPGRSGWSRCSQSPTAEPMATPSADGSLHAVQEGRVGRARPAWRASTAASRRAPLRARRQGWPRARNRPCGAAPRLWHDWPVTGFAGGASSPRPGFAAHPAASPRARPAAATLHPWRRWRPTTTRGSAARAGGRPCRRRSRRTRAPAA